MTFKNAMSFKVSRHEIYAVLCRAYLPDKAANIKEIL